MRVKCPYCEKAFTVFPIPTRQAIQHRRAGLVAWAATLGATFLVCIAVGPDWVGGLVRGLAALLGARLGAGAGMVLLTAPVVFVSLAIYDRMVPHFARPIGEPRHCASCGYVFEGLNCHRCPECGEAI